jgi:hypothetical protein
MADIPVKIENQKINVPGSSGNKENRRDEMLRRYERCKDYYKGWNDEAEEDTKFALGDQWTDSDRQALADVGRPCLTFNRINPMLSIISGYQRENDARIRVRPEGYEDKLFSDVIDKCFKYIDKTSKMDYKLGFMFDEGTTTGKGFIEGFISYDDEPIRGQLDWRLIPARQVYVDPDCVEYDLNKGAEFVMKVGKYTRAKLKAMFPKKKNVIDSLEVEQDNPLSEGDKDNYGNRPNSTTHLRTSDNLRMGEDSDKDALLTLVEEWHKVYVTKYFVLNRTDDDNEIQEFKSKDEAQAFADSQGGGDVFDRQVPQMWVSSMINGELIQDVISPFDPHYNGFPIFRYIAKWSPTCKDEKIKIQGVVRALKDPQKEKNKSHSQMLHILNTQANTGWIADDNAMSEEGFAQLEKMGSVPGVVVKQRPGTNIREINVKGIPSGQLNREQMADMEFKQVSGVNTDLMGMQGETASGRAIALRIKQAVTILIPQFTNYRLTKEIVGKFVLQMIPHCFDTIKLKKVLGQTYLMTEKSERYPEGLTDGVLSAFLTLVKDNKYDIEITENDKSKTMRSEIFDQLVELAKTPAGQALPPELIIDYMDISDANGIKAKMAQQRQLMAQQAAQQQRP